MPEAFPAPEEIFSLPLTAHGSGTGATTRLLAADLGPAKGGIPILAVVRETEDLMELVIMDMATGKAIRETHLEATGFAKLSAGPHFTAIVSTGHGFEMPEAYPKQATSLPTPKLHIFETDTLASVTWSPPSPEEQATVFALSGRLLAYVTDQAPVYAGSSGRGSIVHARSATTQLTEDDPLAPAMAHRQTSQEMVLSSAMAVGGFAARGVWGGMKAGMKLANQARTRHLSNSAPSEVNYSMDDKPDMMEGTTGVHGQSDASSIDSGSSEAKDLNNARTKRCRASWIKVVDLSPRGGGPPTEVAHFQLPPSRLALPNLPASPSSRAQPDDQSGPVVSFLSFSPTGTTLFAAPQHGRSFHILDIRPAEVAKTGETNTRGTVWHTYELRRGHTRASVQDAQWSPDGRFISITTGKGTVHIYAIHPAGGPVGIKTHTTPTVSNPGATQPLSFQLMSMAQFRAQPDQSGRGESANEISIVPTAASFGQQIALPRKDGMRQDIFMFRGPREVNTVRITLRPPGRADKPGPSSPEATAKRSGALSEMLRRRMPSGSNSDMDVTCEVKKRWILPERSNEDAALLLENLRNDKQNESVRVTRTLALAEINTYSPSSRSLPVSIYQSRQISFFAARPTDEYSPLSVMDPEAREKRLTFRPEVTPSPGLVGAIVPQSFDEPLLSALHTIIEDTPAPRIPGLPNGPTRAQHWTAFPIRQFASGIGDGVERIRREYTKAQQIRGIRRSNEGHVNQLSFEEDVVFPASVTDGGESSPSSGAMPDELLATSSTDDQEWGDKWEEEYRRAVEDDGSPEELILGVMDEEAEDRRKWEERRRRMTKDFEPKAA